MLVFLWSRVCVASIRFYDMLTEKINKTLLRCVTLGVFFSYTRHITVNHLANTPVTSCAHCGTIWVTWPSAGAPSSIFKPILSYISHTKPTSYEKVLREVYWQYSGLCNSSAKRCTPRRRNTHRKINKPLLTWKTLVKECKNMGLIGNIVSRELSSSAPPSAGSSMTGRLTVRMRTKWWRSRVWVLAAVTVTPWE